MKRFQPLAIEKMFSDGMGSSRKLFDAALKAAGVSPATCTMTDFSKHDDVFVLSEQIAHMSKRPDDPEEGVSVLRQFWQHLRWLNNGKVIFDLDTRLAGAFMETTVPLRGDDVRIVLPSFYLAVQPSNMITTERGCPLDGLYVSCVEGAIEVLGMSTDDTVTYFNIGLLPNVDIETFFEHGTAEEIKQGKMRPEESAIRLARVVVNAMLYLASEDADVERVPFVPAWVEAEAASRSRKMGERLIRQHDDTTILYSTIGKKIGATLDPRVTSRGEAAYENDKRFIVRGHWRQQACGPELKSRKNIWIKPFWKGPEWAEVIATRVQHVDAPEGGVT